MSSQCAIDNLSLSHNVTRNIPSQFKKIEVDWRPEPISVVSEAIERFIPCSFEQDPLSGVLRARSGTTVLMRGFPRPCGSPYWRDSGQRGRAARGEQCST